MTIIRRSDCPALNAAMTEAGYEIIAIETYHWPDGGTETEILWGREAPPITGAELPF
ncbi:hypothetical protein ACMV_04130 [Acidiphilium multivorum AIU301]|uniref:Uncharacterized protein n=1 Tax=Acidiphilium multivorum (strain DSM 11245 / JCM 8867 / NBRC 100883 / AIU 301) TaxID=926570 RepID=F0J2X1_ACIMA|nr:hypothetical protein [Acidiphilium multivorum]BAJ79760.1 hypothetical protein ACMV_04130 [Acidiphilium multivorum AIU301]GAN72732.1 hypothetical protein Apmu_0022_05 [Acidiphilium multivorum AIU301]